MKKESLDYKLSLKEKLSIRKNLLIGDKEARKRLAATMVVTYGIGLAAGSVGRGGAHLSGLDIVNGISTIPPVIDIANGTLLDSVAGMPAYVAYGAGVATAYADKICSVAKDFF